jgi:serine protease
MSPAPATGRPLRRSLVAALALVAAAATLPGAARAADPATRVVVRFKLEATPAERTAALRAAGVRSTFAGAGGSVVGRLPTVRDAERAAVTLRRRHVVAWAAPALRARIAGTTAASAADTPAGLPSPNDTGTAAKAARAGGWSQRQWDFTGPFGIRAPEAWALAKAAGGEGGRGVIVAVLDTGVAYADRGVYRRSPDLPAIRMVRGRDFVGDDDYSNDDNGHGTFVASEIAAAANNGYGMVGVAYAAKIMAVRVLDEFGEGSSYRVARGIRYAVDHGARVLNVSIELSDGKRPVSLTSAPDIRAALEYARQNNVSVVAAAGNSAVKNVPAGTFRSLSIQVGGTTEHGCIADYSNSGPGLDLVAPGGGADSSLVRDDPHCQPRAHLGRSIRQVTFRKSDPGRFLVPGDFEGTSMAAPHVTGTIALMLAARTLGPDPTPDAVSHRLKKTARDLGAPGPDSIYGAGLLDTAAALGAAPLPPESPAAPPVTPAPPTP